MRLIHFDREVITLNRDYLYPNDQRDAYFKPKGLWVSDEADFGWEDWCNAEDFDGSGRIYQHQVELYPDHNILIISTVDQIDRFHEEYSVDVIKGERPSWLPPRKDWLNWREVYPLWQGIIITPYLWERRMQYMWYYGWDCASGCIWDLSAIRTFQPMLKQLTEGGGKNQIRGRT